MSARHELRLPVIEDLGTQGEGGLFRDALEAHGLRPLVRGEVTTLQVNVGKLCNQACHHCHVEAGPKRTEIMPRGVAERVVVRLERNPGIELGDLTGGAPELNPRWLVTEARRLGRRVIDRRNLTVLSEPGMDDLAEFLARHEVHVVASLPCCGAENVEKQRVGACSS
jgi:radical SAM/Cys-rich protein